MRFVCGKCGHQFDVEGPVPSGKTKCPKCKHAISVPHADPDARQAPPLLEALQKQEDGFARQARKVVGRRIRVKCGKCGKTLLVGMRLAGRNGRCPSCGHTVAVPHPADEEESELGQFAAVSEETEELVVNGEGEPPGGPPQPVPDGEPTSAPGTAGAQADGPSAAPSPALAAFAPSADEQAPSEVLLVPWTTRRLPRRALLAGAVTVLILLTALLIALWLRPGTRGPGSSDAASPRRTGQTGAHRPDPNLAGTTEPADRPSTREVEPAPPPPSPPKEVLANCRVFDATAEMFAADGYYPARLSRVYWKLNVRITAGARPLEVSTAGPDVTVGTGGKTFESLGSPGGGGVLPRRSTGGRVHLDSGQTGAYRFLFDVPRSLRAAMLQVRGAEAIQVNVLDEAVQPGKGALRGTYEEQPPRNLRPLLRHPVMAAIQSVANQRLVVEGKPEAPVVTIVAAGVSGPAKPAGQGVYQVALKSPRGQALDARLRLFDGGRRLLLYLSDQPFHQITYQKLQSRTGVAE